VDAGLKNNVPPRKILNQLKVEFRPGKDASAEAIKRFASLPSHLCIRDRRKTIRRQELRLAKKRTESANHIPVTQQVSHRCVTACRAHSGTA